MSAINNLSASLVNPKQQSWWFQRRAVLRHTVSLRLCGGFGFTDRPTRAESSAELLPLLHVCLQPKLTPIRVHVSQTTALIFLLNKRSRRLMLHEHAARKKRRDAAGGARSRSRCTRLLPGTLQEYLSLFTG